MNPTRRNKPCPAGPGFDRNDKFKQLNELTTICLSTMESRYYLKKAAWNNISLVQNHLSKYKEIVQVK